MNLTQFNRILRQVFLLPIIALLITAWALYLQVRGANETVRQIQEADATIAQVAQVAKLIIDQESGLRGYEATGDDRFLTDYRQAEGSIQSEFNNLALMVQFDDTQRHNIEDLSNGYQNWHDAFALPIIATVRAGGKANDVTLNLYGKTLMDQVRQDLAAITHHTEARRSDRIQQWHRPGSQHGRSAHRHRSRHGCPHRSVYS